MNRIEIVGLFTAMKELAKSGNMQGIENIIDAVLNEAVTTKKDQNSKEDKNA